VTSVGSKIITDIGKGVGDIGKWAITEFGHIGQDIINAMTDLDKIGQAIVSGIVTGIKDAGSAIWDAIKSTIKASGGIVGDALSKIGLAEGGIVTKPTLALVGEAGYPEAVIPLKNGLSPVAFTNSVNQFVGGSGVNPYAPSSLPAAAAASTKSGQTINVFAQTNANASQIAQEMAWAAKTVMA
jgi:SLT domain-containing protein